MATDLQGVFLDMPEDKYHSITYKDNGIVSSSFLKKVLDGVIAVKYDMEVGFKASDAQQLGTLVHEMVLEPELFESKYVFVDKPGRRGTKAYKSEMSELQNKHEGKEILFNDQKRVLDSIKGNIPNDLLYTFIRYKSEATLFAMLEGRKQKCRFDSISWDHGNILDLKTTSNFGRFRYDVRNYGYDLQAFMYSYMAESFFDREFNFIWVVLETVPPYRVGWYKAVDSLAFGESHYLEALDKLKAFEDSGFEFNLGTPEEL